VTARTVLQPADITRALTRISHEILESNRGGDDLVILGIPTRGVELARRIGTILDSIEPGSGTVGFLDVTMYRDDLAGQPTRAPSPTQIPLGGINGKTVVLVDDVLYSGRTIRAALDAIGDIGRPRAVRLAAFVPPSTRSVTMVVRARCAWPCSWIAATASFRSVPTLWAKTFRPRLMNESVCVSPRPTVLKR
jgi:pyrimidine operon attenuation protein/uracil phosphoribosyltransferase